MAIADIMTTDLIVISADETVARAFELLESIDVRHLPVVDDQRLVGLLSDRDLREYRLPVAEELADPERADRLLATPVSEVMSSDVISVDVSEPLRAVVDAMIEYRVGALPVLERDTSRLVGIISYVDLLEELRARLEPEE
ncbi:MAG: CBS domain-containing protein [Myxococcales bacterium]|nr:CBS domain-containing protein [Myxococcales bacterium]MCB9755075.1 CBS domain-containing protein [Myxococcales bacterium]